MYNKGLHQKIFGLYFCIFVVYVSIIAKNKVIFVIMKNEEYLYLILNIFLYKKRQFTLFIIIV